MDFIDSDQQIEDRTGVSISTIFDIEGEEGFRKREAQMIFELVPKKEHCPGHWWWRSRP